VSEQIKDRLIYVFARQAKVVRTSKEPVAAAYAIMAAGPTEMRKVNGFDHAFSGIHTHWGFGSERDVSVMIVHAMLRLLGFLDLHTADGDPPKGLRVITNYLNVITSRMDSTIDKNTKRQQNALAEHRRHKNVRETDSAGLWSQFALLSKGHNVRYSNATFDHIDLALVKLATNKAVDKAREASVYADLSPGQIRMEDSNPLDWLLQIAS
jgi:hypothetical protein